jgi:hypothetical protein
MFNEWLGGAALLGLLAACWSQIRMLFWRVLGRVIVRVRVEGEAGQALMYYCWRHFKRSPFGERRYSAFPSFVRPTGRVLTVGYEHVGSDPIVFWRGWRPLVVNYLFHKSESSAPESLAVYFLRGTFDSDRLVIEALDLANDRKHTGERRSRYEVMHWHGHGPKKNSFGNGAERPSDLPKSSNELTAGERPDWRVLRWSRDDLGAANDCDDPYGAYVFPDEVIGVVEEARRWKASERWYKSKRIPWRRGLLLYGVPGTGKTSLVRALAQDLNMPVVVFDLASYANEDFSRDWRRLMNYTPVVALIEDVDAVFAGRENRLGDQGGGLTFDCLLNCLSGIEAADGVLVCVTTNKVEELDDALGKPGKLGSTRPGRIDCAVELPVMDEACRRQLAERILADCPDEVEAVVEQGDGMTGAQFQYLCSQVALNHYWSGTGRNGEVAAPGGWPLTYGRC